MNKILSSMSAAAIALVGFSATASATVIDFTSAAVPILSTADYVVTGTPVNPGTSGDLPPFSPLPYTDGTVLAGLNDGLGVRNSEIGQFGEFQSITVTFLNGPVRLVSAYLLDLYVCASDLAIGSCDAGEAEHVTVTSDYGGSADTFGTEIAGETGGDGVNDIPGTFDEPGRGLLVADLVGESFTFTVGTSNDNFGVPDAALAAIRIAPVPLPASALLLLAGVGGLAAMRRRNAA
ncbi:VPLPA-CTERM sorting domain-containing protein [Gymnodinialimonas sp. 2305UL16-5]|uniref:VPLPA-CTERM sorting domain-containing protein n=1 Tax=Gymnodinialimonas mytili TaxID=3126503 RepID=UPI0030A7FA00